MKEKCVYCGERPATKRIPDPNGSLETWKVCEGCHKVIAQQQKLALGHIIGRSEHGREFGSKMVIEAEQELKRLAEKEGLNSFSAYMFKKAGKE